MREVINCKDCKYFGEADNEEPEYHVCKYFTSWATVYYMLSDDGCTCGKRMDEVEE